MNRSKVLVPLSAAVVGVLLAGCSSSPSALQSSQRTEVTAAPSAQAPSASATPTPSGLTALAAPDGIDPNAALAWDALFGLDGEYAAAASYLAVLDHYGQVEPYASIYRQELNHIDALVRQLDRFGIAAPANPYLGVIAAPADLQSAAEAWAEGEILNVELYDRLIAASTDSRLTGVFENLRSASLDRHLPLFQEAAANGGTL